MPHSPHATPPHQDSKNTKVSHQAYQNIDLYTLAEKIFALLKEDLRITRERVGHPNTHQ